MPTVPVDDKKTCQEKLNEAGRRVRSARERSALSQMEVATAAKVTINTLRGVEAGADVRVGTLLRVCAVLEVKLGDLFGGV